MSRGLVAAYLTGKTLRAGIIRDADGLRLDWNDNAFKSAGWTTRLQNLTEDGTDLGRYTIVPTSAPWDDGLYEGDLFDTTITTQPIGIIQFNVRLGLIEPLGYRAFLVHAQGVQKNAALANFIFTMYSADQHQPMTGLSPVCRRTIDGGSEGTCTNSPASEVGNGRYRITLSAADLNGDVIAFRASGVNAEDTELTILTVQP